MDIVFAPNWFVGSDILIEFFSFVVLFIFFILCTKSFNLTKNKKTLILGRGFLLIAIAQLATILTKVVIYNHTTALHNIGVAIISYNIVKTVNVFYYIGFFFHRLLTLLGFYMIYRISLAKKSEPDVLLVIYFLMISAVISNFFYYIFHITILVLLTLIIRNYCLICKKNQSYNTKTLLTAFIIMSIAQLVFIFSVVECLYIAGQTLELVSYLTLLMLILRILQKSKISDSTQKSKSKSKYF
jgi:hypothetical protein